MTRTTDEKSFGTEKDAWTAPSIKCVVPLSHTRGGFFNVNDQDDVFYKNS